MPAAYLDRMLRPVHRWVWGDFDRRVRKLLAFAEVETDGGRDILRAAEVTPDPLLRRLYLEHAIDELHHGDLFRERGAALLRTRPTPFSGAVQRAAAARRPRARRSAHRGRARPSAARVPARRGEGGRRPLRDLSRCRRRRSADARDLRRDPARRSLPHELHLHAARAHLAAARTGGTCGARAPAACGNGICASRRRIAGVFGAAMLTLMYFVAAAAVCVAGASAPSGASRRAGCRSHGDRRRRADEPVLT